MTTDVDNRGVCLVHQYFQVPLRPPKVKSIQRQAEYDECVLYNLHHEHVKEVHVLLETKNDETFLKNTILSKCSSDKIAAKLKSTILGRQMQYSDAFQYCNTHLLGKLAVILNSDIFLGQGVDKLLEQRDIVFSAAEKVVLSLTRHEKDLCKHYRPIPLSKQEDANTIFGDATIDFPSLSSSWCGCPFIKGNKYFCSHDSFWFIPPISQNVIHNCQHVQNRWGSEHKVINELFRSGYTVQNPSVTIRTFHNHASDIHPWRYQPDGKIHLANPRDHMPLPPTEL